MKDLKVREAKEEDAPIISKLVYETEDTPEHEWGYGTKDEILSRIECLVNTKNSRYYYKYIKIAELEEKVCGAIILLKGEEIFKLDLNTSFKILTSLKGIVNKIRYLLDIITEFSLDECKKGELYIANIATLKEFRGIGVGKELMKLADNVAKLENYNKCSLLAKDKELILYYSRFNYKLEKEEKYFNHRLYRMLKVV